MKKLVSLMLAAALALSVLAGCSQKASGTVTTDGSTGQLLAVLAVVRRAGDGFKAVPGSTARLSANQDNLCVVSTHIFPVGNFAGKDFGDGVHIEIRNGVVGVDDHRNAVIGQHRPGQALGGFFRLQVAAAEADIAAPLQDCLNAGAG